MATARLDCVARVYVNMNQSSEVTPKDTEFAGEYVLRVLPEDAHRAAAVRAASDPAFAAEVRFWEERLSSLTDDIMPVVPHVGTKTVLMDTLFGADAPVGFFDKVSVWKKLTGVLAAAAAALAVLAFVPEMVLPKAPRFVSSLQSETSDLQILAVYDGGTESLQITRTAGAPADGRVFQLWCIVEGKQTWSVAVLSDDQAEILSLPASWLEGGNGWSIAISEEMPGGSTADGPTGEVIAVAEMVSL